MSGPIRVLYVEDDPEYARLAARRLERVSDRLSVTVETDSTAAPGRIERERVDCVVSDYRMPELDGLALLGRIREQDPDLPVIMFSNSDPEGLAPDALEAGATDYLQKRGFESIELLANSVERAVERHRARGAVERVRAGHRRVAQALSDAILTVDDRGTVVFANQGVERLLGYDPEEMEGESVYWFLADPPESALPFGDGGDGDDPGRDRTQAGTGDGPAQVATADDRTDGRSVPVRGRHADGREVPLSVSFTQIEAADGRVFTGVVRRREDHETGIERPAE